jgi:outer membrane protein assembly factor BamB
MRLLLSLTACLVASVRAVFPDEAYEVDYHHALLGFPQQHTTFFHQPYANSKASLLYTLSEDGVIGAVNPKDGSLIWRQFLTTGSNSTDALLSAGEGQDLVVSAVDGTITAWGGADGRFIWETKTQGKIKDINVLESGSIEAKDGVKDIIAVVEDSHTSIKRLDGKTGKALWQYADERYTNCATWTICI